MEEKEEGLNQICVHCRTHSLSTTGTIDLYHMWNAEGPEGFYIHFLKQRKIVFHH